MANDGPVTRHQSGAKMKFVYFGYDFMLDGVKRLLAEGHELAGVFTFECDNIFNFNREIIALAQDLGVKIVLGKPEDLHLDYFLDHGAECFLAAGYPFKIPPVPGDRAYAINLHPSLLPLGRGIMPSPYIIMHHPEAAGVTLHKMSQAFDAGDILHQEAFKISPRESVETLSARVALRGPDILSMVMADLPQYWNKAKPQNHKKALHFPPPDDRMRTLGWSAGVEHIDKTARAFGRYGSLAHFDDSLWVVYALGVWQERHSLTPGSVACRQSREIVIAAKDGFVCLTDFQRAPLH